MTSEEAREREGSKAEDDAPPSPAGQSGDGEEEEEEEKCAFCRFMKGGPCKTVFVAWEKCVDQARDKGEDFVDLCLDKTKALKECLEANPDYYAPVLDPPEDGEGEPAGEQDGASAEKVGEGEPAGQQASGAGSGKETA